MSRSVTLAASTGAALVSIITGLYTYGIIGSSESHQSIGNIGAAWVRLDPSADTAEAIGDTIHFAATVADRNGSVLIGARPTWTSADSSIATVAGDGAVVARGPGSTTISAIVGTLVSKSRIVVRQHVAGIVISNPHGDTAAAMLEGAALQLSARPVDARGHTVSGRATLWHVDDTTIAGVDVSGLLTARDAGRSVVTAKVDGAAAYMPIAVVTAATTMTAVAGSNQHAPAGRTLPQRIVVRATNRRGAPTPGKLVTFRLMDAHGRVDPPTATTDADGRARTQWTLGPDPGRQVLLANVENLDTALTIEAESDAIAANTRVAAVAEHLRARAGTELSDSVGVRVTDSTGRVLPDVPVRWTALQGSVEAVDARTDSLGIARAHWTLAARAGTQRLRAYVGSTDSRIAPLDIDVAALAGAPVTVEIVSGDKQIGPAGSTLAHPVTVRVVDADGNGVAGVSLTLSPSGGQLPDTTLVTDSLGIASTRWTMGRSAGEYTLAVHVDSIKTLLKIPARARPAVPANLSFDDAPRSERGVRPHTKKLVALVTDIYGNPVPDVRVTLTTKSGTVSPARAITDGKGRVALTWVLGTKTGDQSLSGVVRGTDVKGAYLTRVLQAGAPKPLSTKSRSKP